MSESTESTECVARVRDLTKRFKDGRAERTVLDHADFEVERGQFVCVLGQSGSGKSTLLGILGGLDRSYQGKVELFGQDIALLNDRKLSRLRGTRIGFVFQAFHLLGHLSVLDNVLTPAWFAEHDSSAYSDLRNKAKELLDRLGLVDRAQEYPSALSGGQRQRVAIARALLHHPDLLLCDEPTGNLDRDIGGLTIELFSELHKERGITVVAVTHEERLRKVATRVFHLRDGKLLADAPAEAP